MFLDLLLAERNGYVMLQKFGVLVQVWRHTRSKGG